MKKRRFQNFEHFEHFEQKNFGWTIPLLQVNFQEYVEIHGVNIFQTNVEEIHGVAILKKYFKNRCCCKDFSTKNFKKIYLDFSLVCRYVDPPIVCGHSYLL